MAHHAGVVPGVQRGADSWVVHGEELSTAAFGNIFWKHGWGGLLTIGMASCSALRQLHAILQALGARRVVLCPDADVRSNRLVAQGLLSTVAALQGAGYEVMIEGWAPAAGKGIDDVLSVGRGGEVTRYAGARVGATLRSIAGQAGVVVPYDLSPNIACSSSVNGPTC